jgi:hypothetical protein
LPAVNVGTSPPTQDGHALRRCERQWTVENTIAEPGIIP